MKVDMLVFGAHADDAEIGMGGTIFKHTEKGVRVAICDLTCGEMSSNGTIQRRKQEAQKAAEVLGVCCRTNLNLPDRGLCFTGNEVELITAHIRQYAPTIVFAPYWEDRHPDHVMCSKLVEEAVFNASLHKYMPNIPPVRVEQLYYYFINDTASAPLIVDISAQYKQKQAALLCYASQFNKEEGGVCTLLNQGYLDHICARDRTIGRYHFFAYAESFMCKKPYAVTQFTL